MSDSFWTSATVFRSYPCHLCNPRFALLLLLLTQTEIVTKHWLERFPFSVLKVSDARRIDRSERGANFCHVRALPPNGQREHFDHYLAQWFVTGVRQFV